MKKEHHKSHKDTLCTACLEERRTKGRKTIKKKSNKLVRGHFYGKKWFAE